MAQTSPPELSEQVIRRYHDLVREQDELNHKYKVREEEELRALEDAKRKIEDDIRQERERLVRDMPAHMPFPESFDDILKQKRDGLIKKRQDDYELRKRERKERHDAETLKQAEKWRYLLPTPSSVSNLDLALPEPRPSEARPKKPVEIALPPSVPPHAPHPSSHPPHPSHHPQVHPSRPVDMRAMGQQREAPVHVLPSQQPHQYAGIALPLLPRPPVVPSQPAPTVPQRAPNGVYLHHAMSQPRPLEAQRVVYPGQPPARLPEQPPMAKQRTALPETARVPERRPELARASPQGSYSLPRILPLGEQHQARSENEQFKRKAEGPPAPPLADKRPKVQESKPNDGARPEQLPGLEPAQKTISFDEVYCNGNPQFKHIIVQHPQKGDGDYYILKCEEHGVHFNQNPLAGAAKHLHSAQHGNLSKERSQAVKLLGYRVIDCDENKKELNNQMVHDAFQNGYKPLNLNQLTKAERASLNLPGDNSPTATPPRATPAANVGQRGNTREASQKQFIGITHPVAGELYLGYWPNEKRNYAVLMLPFGDLKIAGMQGTLETTGLLDPSRLPKCYVFNTATKVWDWAPGYEEGGPYVTKREFPVLYIDGRNSVGWLSAKDLSLFNFDDPLWREIPYFKEATELYARNKGYPSYFDMRAKDEKRDWRQFYGQSQHQSQQRTLATVRPPTVSLPPTTLPSQPTLIEKSRLNTDSQNRSSTMIPPGPVEQVGTAEASPVSDKDSYQASINKGLDSDNDVEMANTESRRTSVSNRGENQVEHGAPEQVLKQPFAQPIPPAIVPPRPVDVARPYSESSRGGVYVMPPTNGSVVPATPSPAHQAVSSSTRPTNDFAQMIASRALHLQSPERDQPSVSASAQSGDFNRPTVARSEIGSSGSGSASTNGGGYRRVDKIFAKSSNPYRTSPSQSPAMSTSILPEPRPENASSQASISRNSSPASLNNILQNPSPQPQAVMARPGPLSQNGPASLQPHLRPLPLDQSAASTASPPMRSPKALAGFAHTIQAPPSPPHSNGLGIQPSSRSPALEQLERPMHVLAQSPAPSNPPTRTPTPVIFKGSNDLVADRWRAVRAESTLQSDPSTRVPAPPESPREPALMTPVTSVNETRSNSPTQVRDSGASPAPSVKVESGDSYALARVTDNKEVIFDHSEARGRLLPILVDPQSKTASGSPRPGVELVVDPHKIKQAIVRPSESPTASNVTLRMTDGKELDLVFETWELSVGRIHARRFCRWLKSVNPVLEIDNRQASSIS